MTKYIKKEDLQNIINNINSKSNVSNSLENLQSVKIFIKVAQTLFLLPLTVLFLLVFPIILIEYFIKRKSYDD